MKTIVLSGLAAALLVVLPGCSTDESAPAETDSYATPPPGTPRTTWLPQGAEHDTTQQTAAGR